MPALQCPDLELVEIARCMQFPDLKHSKWMTALQRPDLELCEIVRCCNDLFETFDCCSPGGC